ncbi:MAG TPA: phenylalanine--tRNA ligase subunit alpha [Candidatus Dormibacteraeota bacterium]|nr:phenylalanine--tRNA ligase subunit alpha [Candidatus Dormibacteraeota bacterium]
MSRVEEIQRQTRALAERALEVVAVAADEETLGQLRAELLGARSELMRLPKTFASLAPEERPAAGQAFNQARSSIEAALARRAEELRQARLAQLGEREAIDVTFPGRPPAVGRLHVLTRVQREVETIMERMGYHVEDGPEVETDWYNFEALNLPRGHAVRDMQDTFFFTETEDLLLRTHTSPMQIRSMERLQQPPIFVIVPGRTYRRDATDASHLAQFMQMEALAIDEGLTVGDLKGTILYFAQSLWGPERRVRIRPSFFPYTEPSFEFDLSCGVCGGAGCRACGGDGWLEVGGCGMVHPNVLRNGGIDPDRYTGFAWGFGIERIAMLRHDVDDLRLFYENDLRFLEQL